jgi:transcription antitermination factor NusA-like protein
MEYQMEQLVISAINSLKKNDAYLSQIKNLEAFIKQSETDPLGLTTEQKEALPEIKTKIEELRTIVNDHYNNLKREFESRGLLSVFETAITLKDVL